MMIRMVGLVCLGTGVLLMLCAFYIMFPTSLLFAAGWVFLGLADFLGTRFRDFREIDGTPGTTPGTPGTTPGTPGGEGPTMEVRMLRPDER